MDKSATQEQIDNVIDKIKDLLVAKSPRDHSASKGNRARAKGFVSRWHALGVCGF